MHHFRAPLFVLSVLSLWLAVTPPAVSQKARSISILSQDLIRQSIALTGDSAAWPVIIALAERDLATNGFVLNVKALDQLKSFSGIHRKVLAARSDVNRYIKAGARVFAAEPFSSALSAMRTYDNLVQRGRADSAILLGPVLVKHVDGIRDQILANRTEDVDAKIAQKSGSVDKKKGVLAQWNTAFVGDLLAESDGLRTGERSFAQLVFTDGVDVVVDPVSTLIIRASKMDKLDQTVQRDIALVKGSLLTKLNSHARESNNFTFRAASAESQVKSGKFWASASDKDGMRLSNYDGAVDVRANNVKITVNANQGTVVERGKAPLPPVNLLDPPVLAWSRFDTVIYGPAIVLQWRAVAGVARYMVELCPDKGFSSSLRRFAAEERSLVLKDLPLGATYVRLQSIDKHGLRSADSPVYTVIRNQDTQPPAIQLEGWDIDLRYTIAAAITIRGTTEADAHFLVNGKPATVNPDGSFAVQITVERPEKKITLAAIDQSGNKSERTLTVISMDPDRVGRAQWNCPVHGDTLAPSSQTVNASGTAYPRIRITATTTTQNASVQTDSQGRWGISLRPEAGTVTLTFESIDDKKVVIEKRYIIR